MVSNADIDRGIQSAKGRGCLLVLANPAMVSDVASYRDQVERALTSHIAMHGLECIVGVVCEPAFGSLTIGEEMGIRQLRDADHVGGAHRRQSYYRDLESSRGFT